jgi:hypothetical protein
LLAEEERCSCTIKIMTKDNKDVIVTNPAIGIFLILRKSRFIPNIMQ